MAKNVNLEAAGQAALAIMQRSVKYAQKGASITVVEVEEEIKTLAKKHGLSFADVEKEAQRLSKGGK